jgi:hypothetical protein
MRCRVDINELGPSLRVDEINGAEVRSSDDKIIGEVRNVVLGTKDRWDYAIVASGTAIKTVRDYRGRSCTRQLFFIDL